jgi:RNA polymerase sigma factor (sigma-70 family)
MKYIKLQTSRRTDQDLLARVKRGDETAIREVYKAHRSGFVKWATYYYNFDEDTASDVFQDAVILFYENVRKGRLTELSSSLKTYLYAIAKNVITNRSGYYKKVQVNSETVETSRLESDQLDADLMLSERQRLVGDLLNKLGEPCRSILELFYFKSYAMDAIASELNYKNENVVKSQKLRCITELKKMVKTRYSREDI